MQIKLKFKIIIFIIFNIFILFIGTQTFAKGTNYHSTLGSGIFKINNITFYNPLLIISWIKYGKSAPKSLELAQRNMFLGYLIGIIVIFFFKRKTKDTNLGSAKWGDENTIKKANLYNNKGNIKKELETSRIYNLYKKTIKDENEILEDGVVLGKDLKGKTIYHEGSEHILMVAPTRSGKGVGVIIPTLLTWKHSTVVLDIKGENYNLTHKYRESIGQKCFKFSPLEVSSCSYNPLNEIRKGTFNEYDDARIIAEIICATDKPDHWSKSASDFLTGVILYIIYSKENGSLSDVVDFITSAKSIEDKIVEMSSDLVSDDNYFFEIYKTQSIERYETSTLNEETFLYTNSSNRCHPKVVSCASDLYNKADKERDSIISTAKTNISIFQSPLIAKNTKTSDFKISDLMNSTKPLNLYLVSPPRSIDLTGPLFRILITQIIYNLTEQMKFDKNYKNIGFKHRLLLLLDEFPTIGRVPLIEKALAFISGYGIKALIITQDLNQINRIYTKDNSILSNCYITILYTPSRMDNNTLSLVSKSLGSTTIHYKTKSWKGFKYLSDWNYSEQIRERKLLTEGEVATFDKDKNIILINGFNPIQGLKIKYYNEKKYLDRLKQREEK